MTFLEKQIRTSIRMVKLDTDDNVEAVSQLPNTMVKVLNIKDMPKQDGKFVKRITFTRYSNISYDELVNGMVRDKYSESAEFAILRKAMNFKGEEFEEYNAYVESCKLQAKAWINNRDGVTE